MKIELKKVKFFDAMSEETPCFTAELWDDGKHVAYVKNSGHGGGNNVYPIPDVNTYKDVMKYDNLDVEAEIFGMVYDFADTKKLQTKHFVLKKDGKMFTVKFPKSISIMKKASNFKNWVSNSVDNFNKDGYVVLNTNI